MSWTDDALGGIPMTVAIDCNECGTQVVFWLENGEATNPTAECDDCGAVYQLRVKRIVEGSVDGLEGRR